MQALKQIFLATIVGACMTTATTVMAIDAAPAQDHTAAWRKYNARLIDALLADGSPHAMILAATTMMYSGSNSDTSAEASRELFKRTARRAPDDAWVQWFAALNADPQTLSESALALQRLEPDNGAVWLFPLEVAFRANDSDGVTEALARIGASRIFDDRFVALTPEWLNFFRTHPVPLPNADAGEQTSATRPLVMAIGRAAAVAMPNTASAIRACKPGEQPLPAERRKACLSAGRLMLTQSNSLISMQIGAVLLRVAGADDAVQVARNADYFTRTYVTVSAEALENPDEFERFQSDWLQTRNEIEVGRNLLTRAGIPLLPPSDWNDDPYANVALSGKSKDS